jgi:cysteine desulfurase
MKPFIYFDHAAATPPLPEVLAAHADLASRHIVNPHAGTRASETVMQAICQAEQRLLNRLGIPRPDAKVVWTSGGTEANNLAIRGFLAANPGIACAIDASAHDSQRAPCPPTHQPMSVMANGQIDLARLADSAGSKQLAGICHVNNETGVIQNLAAIRTVLPKAILAVDAAQSFTKLPIPWHEAQIDLLTLCGRKFGGPAGIAALVIRKGHSLQPILHGGGQQHGLRPGTLDTVGILEFVMAAEILLPRLDEMRKRFTGLNQQLRQGLLTPPWQTTLISPETAAPHILAFSFPGFEGAILARALAERGVVVGTGSACSAETGQPSHVAKAMGFDLKTARGMLRVSFGPESTTEDIDTLLRELATVIKTY